MRWDSCFRRGEAKRLYPTSSKPNTPRHGNDHRNHRHGDPIDDTARRTYHAACFPPANFFKRSAVSGPDGEGRDGDFRAGGGTLSGGKGVEDVSECGVVFECFGEEGRCGGDALCLGLSACGISVSLLMVLGGWRWGGPGVRTLAACCDL